MTHTQRGHCDCQAGAIAKKGLTHTHTHTHTCTCRQPF